MTELKPTRSKFGQLGFSSLTFSCINGPWAGPILNASLNNRDNTYWQSSMMGYVEIIRVAGHWHIELIPKATIGRPCGWMPPPM